MNKKIGVYVCHCGENISAYVDVKKVREIASKEEGVVLAKDVMFACSGSTQKEMIEDIKEKKLDGMVVASCSPKLHLFTFRNVAERAGLNPYKYIQANIREQVSWAHSDNPEGATDKAIKIVKAAIAEVRLSESLVTQKISSENVALVVGAGVSGLRSAIELADMGSDVYLIEKNHFVGGRVAQWGELFSTDERGEQIIEDLYKEVKKRNNITLFTGAEIVSNSGSVGNFKITFKISPHYFKSQHEIEDYDEFMERVKRAINICPEEIPDKFNFGLTKRKALYLNQKGEFPKFPAIDDSICTHCGKCAEICPEIDLEKKEETIRIKVGSIILCTGFDPYEPKEGEFGYKTVKNVLTVQEFRRLIELNDNDKIVYNDKKINNIVYIYCVGSRQIDGENKYCSRFCCSAALHTAKIVKEKYAYVNNFHFHRGIRSYGKNEALYTKVSANGDVFFQSRDDELSQVKDENGNPVISVNDILTEGRNIELKVDLVVLVTAMVPRKNNKLIGILKVPIGRDKFFNEIHPKLRPVETAIDGIYIAGTCQAPKGIEESLSSSLSASVKARSLIGKGEITLEPTMAEIDKESCEWCGECEKVCPFNAIVKEKTDKKNIATVIKANCKGCGMCLPVCPSNSIQLIGYEDEKIKAMVKALVEN